MEHPTKDYERNAVKDVEEVNLVSVSEVLVLFNFLLVWEEGNEGVNSGEHVDQSGDEKDYCELFEPALLHLDLCSYLLEFSGLFLVITWNFKIIHIFPHHHIHIPLRVIISIFLEPPVESDKLCS